MNKIQRAQELADQLIDESTIPQVGDNKGALKDEPESIKKSEEDLEDYVDLEESNQTPPMIENLQTYLGEAGKLPSPSMIAKIRRGVARNDKNYKEGNDMDPKAKANAKKRIEESNMIATAQQKNTLFDKLDNVVKDSDKLKATITQEPTTEAEKKKGGWDYIKSDLGKVKGAIGSIFSKGKLGAPKIQKKGAAVSRSLGSKIFSGLAARKKRQEAAVKSAGE